MNEIIPGKGPKTSPFSEIHAISKRVHASLQHNLLSDDTTFLLYEFTGQKDPAFCKFASHIPDNTAAWQERATILGESSEFAAFGSQIQEIILSITNHKEIFLLTWFLFTLKRYDTVSIHNLLSYLLGPCQTTLKELEVSTLEYICENLGKRLFQMISLSPEIQIPAEMEGYPWTNFGKVCVHTLVAHPELLHKPLPTGLDRYEIFSKEGENLQNAYDLLKTYYTPGLESYIELLLLEEKNGYNRKRFSTYLVQFTTLLRTPEHKEYLHPTISLTQIQDTILDSMENFLHIKNAYQSAYDRKLKIIHTLSTHNTKERKHFLNVFGNYVFVDYISWSKFFTYIDTTFGEEERAVIERYILKSSGTGDIDLYNTTKGLHYLQLATETNKDYTRFSGPVEVEHHIRQIILQESRNRIPENSYTEKQDFLTRKHILAHTLRITRTDEEYNLLFGEIDFKKRYVKNGIPDQNKISQGDLPDCFFVALICGLLPLSFAQELCMNMLSKDARQPGVYNVNMGGKIVSVTEEERKNRNGVEAPEFVKIIEIAFQKMHLREFKKEYIKKVRDNIGKLSVMLGLLASTRVSSIYIVQHQKNSSHEPLFLGMHLITLLLTLFIGTVLKADIPLMKKELGKIKNIKKGSHGKYLLDDGGRSTKAFEIMFKKKHRTTKQPNHDSLENLIEVAADLRGLSTGNSIITSASTRELDNQRHIADHHAYTTIKYNENTQLLSLIDPHDNTKIISMDIMDFLYVFSESDIMKFNLKTLFRE